MNKRVLVSLGVIGVAAAAVIGGTIAYFNDTETSTGNIFTAGSIDLKVDHVWQTYNDADCQTCNVTIQSDTSNQVVAKTPNAGDPAVLPHAALVVTPTNITNTYWTADVSNPSAEWIWATDPVMTEDVLNTVTYTFQKTFEWYGPFDGALVSFSVASDNSYRVLLNGDQIAADGSENNHSASDPIMVDLTPYIKNGVNNLQFEVTNWAQNGPNVNNPAGLLYSLVIDGDCESDYFVNNCSLWGEKDLTDGDTFFNFTDVKPGDRGTNVISLHVYDNDAWACLVAGDFTDSENGLMEPEEDYGDVTENDGELSDYLTAYAWYDDDADGVPDLNEEKIGPSLLRDLGTLGIFDSNSQKYLNSTTTQHVGLYWCAGNILVDQQTGAFSCDGSTMKDDAQTDVFSASLTAYAEQVRNNQSFLCSEVELNPEEPLQ
jgi:predicted ribosomally synthesized peptide with SipW-like signal peptide